MQIASQDVENAFYADTRVAEAAAIGVPDERLGELVGVIVSLHPSAGQVSEQDLLQSVKPRSVSIRRRSFTGLIWLDWQDMLSLLLSTSMTDLFVRHVCDGEMTLIGELTVAERNVNGKLVKKDLKPGLVKEWNVRLGRKVKAKL